MTIPNAVMAEAFDSVALTFTCRLIVVIVIIAVTATYI